jgi:hypothetical protein
VGSPPGPRALSAGPALSFPLHTFVHRKLTASQKARRGPDRSGFHSTRSYPLGCGGAAPCLLRLLPAVSFSVLCCGPVCRHERSTRDLEPLRGKVRNVNNWRPGMTAHVRPPVIRCHLEAPKTSACPRSGWGGGKGARGAWWQSLPRGSLLRKRLDQMLAYAKELMQRRGNNVG